MLAVSDSLTTHQQKHHYTFSLPVLLFPSRVFQSHEFVQLCP